MGFKGILIVLIILIIIAVVGIILYFTVFKKENFDNNEDEFEEYIGSDLKYLEDDYDIDDMEGDDNLSEDLKEKIKDKKTRSDISSKIKDRINKLPESLEETLGKQFNLNKELGTVITDPYYAPYKSNITRKYTKDELMDSSLLLPGQVSNKLKKEFNLPPEAVKLSNEIAPEHLEVVVKNSDEIVDKLINYGSLFIGDLSAEVFGDYVSGTNHTLPTQKAARYTGGVWVGTFIKTCTTQRLSQRAVDLLAPVAHDLAIDEGLYAHANAAKIRMK